MISALQFSGFKGKITEEKGKYRLTGVLDNIDTGNGCDLIELTLPNGQTKKITNKNIANASHYVKIGGPRYSWLGALHCLKTLTLYIQELPHTRITS